MSLNKVMLIGNVGGDPEIRFTQDKKKIASFSLATSERWKDKATGEQKDRTEWHRIVVFAEPIANAVETIVKKGTKVYIEGEIRTRKWHDQNGNDKFATEIVLQGYSSRLEVLDKKERSGSSYESSNDSFTSGNKSKSDNRSSSSSNNFDDISEDDVDDEVPF